VTARRVACVLAALGALVALPAPARAGLVDDLYSNRLLFAEGGRPLVPVRMMEGRARVEIVSAGGLVVETEGGGRAEVAPSEVLVVERVRGRAARTEKRWVLETLEEDARERREEVVRTWAERGLHARVMPTGGVYGMQGTVVDNRALLVTARDPVPGDLFEKFGARPVEHYVLKGMPSLVLRASAPGVASLTSGSDARAAVVRVRPKDGETLVVRQVEHSVGYKSHGFADRELRGEVALVPDRRGMMAVVNIVPEDVLVAGILPSEMFASGPMEALKAQAVTARGELFAKIGRRHASDPYLVCSEQHCQVYKGRTAEHPRSNKAAAATAGELAFLDERVVDSVYSACCGGHTEPSHIVWDRPKKRALIGRPDTPFADVRSRPWTRPAGRSSYFAQQLSHGAATSPAPTIGPVPLDLREDKAVRRFLALPRHLTFCGRSSFNQKGDAYRWERRFTASDLDALFAADGVGTVRALKVEERGPGGRLRSLLVEGSRGSLRLLRELPVRRKLNNLRSGLFVVDTERDAAGALVAVTLRGAGFGHGSGMCQQGAIGMAEMGYSYREILRHYYNGAEVRKVF
jgi:peptidoglycan hydrolase-like amidase